MKARPHVVNIVGPHRLCGRDVPCCAVVRMQTATELIEGVIEISAFAVTAARLGMRDPFLHELAAELCKRGMHHDRCFHVEVRS